jgi:hypothetical protein
MGVSPLPSSIDPFSWFGQLGMTIVELMDGNFEKSLQTARTLEAAFFLKNLIEVMLLLLLRRTDEAQTNVQGMSERPPPQTCSTPRGLPIHTR